MATAVARAAQGLLLAGSVLAITGLAPLAGRAPTPCRRGGPPGGRGARLAASLGTHRTRRGSIDFSGSGRGPPIRLRVHSLGIDAPVIPVTVAAGGELAVPDDPRVAGWWSGGARVGSARGTVVLDGPVDTRDDGPGALFRPPSLRPGDEVSLLTGTGAVTEAVRAMRRCPKSLPAEVFDRLGAPCLVLISCGGWVDQASGHYADNVVIYAVPMGPAGLLRWLSPGGEGRAG